MGRSIEGIRIHCGSRNNPGIYIDFTSLPCIILKKCIEFV